MGGKSLLSQTGLTIVGSDRLGLKACIYFMERRKAFFVKKSKISGVG